MTGADDRMLGVKLDVPVLQKPIDPPLLSKMPGAILPTRRDSPSTTGRKRLTVHADQRVSRCEKSWAQNFGGVSQSDAQAASSRPTTTMAIA